MIRSGRYLRLYNQIAELLEKHSDPVSRMATVLDVDSKELNSFAEVDKDWLERIVQLIYT